MDVRQILLFIGPFLTFLFVKKVVVKVTCDLLDGLVFILVPLDLGAACNTGDHSISHGVSQGSVL